MSAIEVKVNLFSRFFSGRGTNFRPRTSAKTLRRFQTELDLIFAGRSRKSLRVSVGNNELYALKLRLNHVIDRISAGASDAKHDDSWL
tara:strand:- start:46669 stop:46932 length:264 start_codon:yes stop_codon:yes gene_type:complete